MTPRLGDIYEYLFTPSPGYGTIGVVVFIDGDKIGMCWLANGMTELYNPLYFRNERAVRLVSRGD
jgi:hypothetical protein